MKRAATHSIKTRTASAAFSLVEIMVAVAVLAILIVLTTQLMNSATALTRVGVKHIDTDTQARAVLDRIGVDIAKMIKRTDLDYYIKQPSGKYNNDHGQGHGWGNKLKPGQQGSDQLAVFTTVPGYYPAGYAPVQQQSPVSLVAYRVNQNSASPAYLQLERMAKGLLWNGVSNTTSANAPYPIVFLPNTISGVPSWSAAVNNDGSGQSIDTPLPGAYEVIGPQVFRMEYWYLLENGTLTDAPWDKNARPLQTSIGSPTSIGWTDVQAIAVAIAVIDQASRSLIPSATLLDIASDLDDFKSAPGRGGFGSQKKVGDMEYRWNTVLVGDPSDPANVAGIVNTRQTTANSKVPPEVAKSIRVYSRYYDLRIQ